MQRFWILGAVGLTIAGMGVTHFTSVESRLDDLEEFRSHAPQGNLALRAELDRLQSEVTALSLEFASVEAAEQLGALGRRLEGVEGRLDAARSSLAQQRETVAALEQSQGDLSLENLDRRYDERLSLLLSEYGEGTEDRMEGLSQAVSAVVNLAEQTSEELGALEQDLEGPDGGERWRNIVGPTVQLAGQTTVGSGVLLRSAPKEDGEGFETLVLTCWHVVRDIRADAGGDDPPIPVSIYQEDGQIWYETASLMHYDAALDAALLRIDSETEVPFRADLLSRERVEAMKVFRPIYAVGCPLGNDPIPTRGEIADLNHRVDGGTYWMISAPTYIGNSGGGIYDEETHALLGIFSKIYTHGTMRPTVVPHMGLVTPIAHIYDWLEDEGYAELVPAGNGTVALSLRGEDDGEVK